jgi:hypothetical protein
MSKIKINEYHFLQHITAQIKEVCYTTHFAVMSSTPPPPQKKLGNKEFCKPKFEFFF